jgi:hypothetical protein
MIMTNKIIPSAGGGVLSRCGLMQLRTLQSIDDTGPTASKTVLLAIPIEIMELLQRAVKNV